MGSESHKISIDVMLFIFLIIMNINRSLKLIRASKMNEKNPHKASHFFKNFNTKVLNLLDFNFYVKYFYWIQTKARKYILYKQ